MNSMFMIFSHNAAKNDIKEVHINYILLENEKRKKKYLDIGVRLEVGQELELFMPWENANPVDLFDVLKDQDVSLAIFNDQVTFNNTSATQYITLEKSGDRIDLVETDFSSSQSKIGRNHKEKVFTKISIKARYPTSNDSYLRFRFSDVPEGVFRKEQVEKDAVISPYKDIREIIDFRLNEVRVYALSLFGGSHHTMAPKIEKLHFFLIRSFKDGNTLASPNYVRCRGLEDHAWKKYLDFDVSDTDATLAYHWSKKVDSGGHFGVLSTFNNKKTSWRMVFLYLAVVVIVNLLSNYLYDYIKLGDRDNNEVQKSVKEFDKTSK